LNKKHVLSKVPGEIGVRNFSRGWAEIAKTDQSGAGQFVAIPRLETGPCAVAAIEAWLGVREQKKGPLFVAFSPHGELRETRIEGRLVAAVAFTSQSHTEQGKQRGC
jgi:hypothetical protein